MDMFCKHYIEVDAENRIIFGWSDGIQSDRYTSAAICINDQGGYQFRIAQGGEENPPLHTMDGIPRYKYENNTVTLRTETELSTDRANIPEPALTQLDRIEAQVTYTAMATDTLLEE